MFNNVQIPLKVWCGECIMDKHSACNGGYHLVVQLNANCSVYFHTHVCNKNTPGLQKDPAYQKHCKEMSTGSLHCLSGGNAESINHLFKRTKQKRYQQCFFQCISLCNIKGTFPGPWHSEALPPSHTNLDKINCKKETWTHTAHFCYLPWMYRCIERSRWRTRQETMIKV